MKVCFTVSPEEAGANLGRFLRRRGVSLSLLRSLKQQEQGILRQGKRARTNENLNPGEEITLTLPEEEEISALPQEIPLSIVYETEHVMVIDKPAGIVTHPSRAHPVGTLANGFCHLMEQRGRKTAFRPIGRLDGDTSGLVLCAMNPFAAPILGETLRKEYLALVSGPVEPGSGIIEAPLCACEDHPVRQKVDFTGKESKTEYAVLAESKEKQIALVRARPLTGRTHQIRAHFASRGFPLLGDALYGGDTTKMARHALHCCAVCFQEPQGGYITFYSGLPEDMQKILRPWALPTPARDASLDPIF